MNNLAKEVLDEIKRTEEMFRVCNNDELTMKTKTMLSSINWEEIKRNNKIHQKINQDTFVSDDFMPLAQSYINNMYLNKNITMLLPSNTRFRFIKKIIKKLMKVSTRYQEQYNSNNVELISLLCSNIAELKSNIKNIDLSIDDVKKRTEENIASIDDVKKRTEENIASIDDVKKRTEENIASIDDVKKRTEENSNKITNNEAWLQGESCRITGNEKWIESTNKRIDACNEIISADQNQSFATYSQSGEDVIVSMIFSKLSTNVSITSYLDIGANHYKNYNNTFHFYKKGISGVLIEANPVLAKDLQYYRRRDTVVNCGVGTKTGDVLPFYVINGYGLSSFNKEFIDNTLSNDKYARIEETINVPIISINDIIKTYFYDNAPSFISIDIEGDELNILKNMDFNKYRPVVFIIETIKYTPHIVVDQKRSDIIDFMEQQDYTEYAFTGVNSIFIDKKKL